MSIRGSLYGLQVLRGLEGPTMSCKHYEHLRVLLCITGVPMSYGSEAFMSIRGTFYGLQVLRGFDGSELQALSAFADPSMRCRCL